MATEPKPLISDDLLHKVEQTARAQNREAPQVVEEAVGRYLASQRLAGFAERMEHRAREKGIREEDVARLVEEVRHENENPRPVIRATADTNVIVSGLVYRRGKPYELLQRALSGEINLTVSQPILEEMADVLFGKFDATPEQVAEDNHLLRVAVYNGIRILNVSDFLELAQGQPLP